MELGINRVLACSFHTVIFKVTGEELYTDEDFHRI